MQRRHFFQLLSALFTPSLSKASNRVDATYPTRELPMIRVDDSALAQWLRIPMQPIHFETDLPPHAPSISTQLLAAIQQPRAEIQFTYHGGSTPGEARNVLPILLFQKIDAEDDALAPATQAPNLSPIYLLALCLTRHAPRTFRLDRISSVSSISNPSLA